MIEAFKNNLRVVLLQYLQQAVRSDRTTIALTDSNSTQTARNLRLNLTGTSNGRGLDYFTNPGTKSYIFSLKLNF